MSAVQTPRKPASNAPSTALAAMQRKIQIARRQLGMDEATYRAMLRNVAGVDSSTRLGMAGADRVLTHLRSVGFVPKAPARPTSGRPNNMDHPTRGPMLGKVEALLLDARRPWAYAHAMCARMFGIERVDFAHEGQLHKLVAALEVDRRRRAGKAGAE